MPLGSGQYLLLISMTLFSIRQKKQHSMRDSSLTPVRRNSKRGYCPSAIHSLQRLRQLVAPGITGAAARIVRLALVELMGDHLLTEVSSTCELSV
jgi:hypothetical protein